MCSRQWKAPDNFKIEMFVIRVGDWGGYMLAGLRRSGDGAQVLLDAAGVRVRGATGDPDRRTRCAASSKSMAWRDGLKLG